VLRARTFSNLLCGLVLTGLAGCHLVLPQTAHQPVIRNPFPQLSRVAIAPFFNQSDEPTVDGRQFALAYYGELQATPGFDVVPVGVVEEAIIRHRIDLAGPGEARRLAQLLGVDAVIVGAVTDYSPYYPPRIGLSVEWYAADVGFHEIPAGYGLPWGTPQEEFIPDSLVYEAQLAQARAEMRAVGPGQLVVEPLQAPSGVIEPVGEGASLPGATDLTYDPFVDPKFVRVQHAEELPAASGAPEVADGAIAAPESSVITDSTLPGGTASPLAPHSPPPSCSAHHGPVLSHTQIYDGLDHDLTQALQGYVYFRDDKRIGGWDSYLRRSDDFIRFCCHLHISELLSARGGGHKTRLMWRWPDDR
jgi:hypothetical protein